MGALVEVKNVSHVYGDASRPDSAVVALKDVNLSITRGEVCALVGSSGAGKSTLMRIVGGLMPPTAGRVTIDGAPLVSPSHAVAVVFQDYARSLLPWKTVEQNVAMGAERQGRAGHKRQADPEVVRDYLDAVGLGSAARQYPWQLSGGMQQRVAIARALASDPEVLLLDEPFGALDALTRIALADLVIDTVHRLQLTVLLITHDVEEAIYLADRVYALKEGGRLGRASGVFVDFPRPRARHLVRKTPAFEAANRELLTELGFASAGQSKPS